MKKIYYKIDYVQCGSVGNECQHLNCEYEQEDDKSYKLCNDCGVRVK